MLNETSIIHGNIKKFRRLLKEYADRGDIADAIDNREVIYIYYAGDDTIRRGWRTVEPHVLGFIKREDGDGELAVRAWEQAGASDTFKNPVGKYAHHPPREKHEKWSNQKGPFGRTVMPGWRLFKVRGITNMLPTGRNFEVKGEEHEYNPNDKQLDVVVAARPSADIGSQKMTGTTAISSPDNYFQKLSSFDTQSKKWKIDASDQEATLMANVAALYSKISSLDKQAPKYYDLIRDQGKYKAVKYNTKERQQYREDQVVGNLEDLYNKYSGSDLDDRFFKNRKREADIADRNIENM